MGNLQTLLATLKSKPQLKEDWSKAPTGSDAWMEARARFHDADSACDQLAQSLMQEHPEELSEALEVLDDEDLRLLRRFFAERSLPWPEGNGLLSLVLTYRRRDALLTAFKQLNFVRQSATAEALSAELAIVPANVDEKAWRKAVSQFEKELASISEEGPERSLEARQREAEFYCTRRARQASDQADDQLSRVVFDLLEEGRFDSTVARECAQYRHWLYSFARTVPQTMRHPR